MRPLWQTDNSAKVGTSAPLRNCNGNGTGNNGTVYNHLSARQLGNSGDVHTVNGRGPRAHPRLTTDSPIPTGEDDETRMSSQVSMNGSPSKANGKRVQRAGTHTRFDSDDEDLLHRADDRNSAPSHELDGYARTPGSVAMDLDDISLPSRLGSSASSPASSPESDNQETSRYRARCSTYSSGSERSEEQPATPPTFEHVESISNGDDYYEAETPLRKRRKRHRTSTSSSRPTSQTPSPSPQSSKSSSPRSRRRRRRSSSSSSAKSSSPNHPALPTAHLNTTCNDDRQTSPFDSKALSSSLKQFLEHASTLDRSRLGPENAGPSSRPLPLPASQQTWRPASSYARLHQSPTKSTLEPPPSHPAMKLSYGARDISNVRDTSPFSARSPSPAPIVAKHLLVADPTPGPAPTPGAPTHGAPTPRPSPPRLVVTSPTSPAPTPTSTVAPLPTATVTATATASVSTQTDPHPELTAANGSSNVGKDDHRHPCWPCVLRRVVVQVVRALEDEDWFTQGCVGT